jgi:sugar O-acyltransferase (sialic acid O-acetyltransferase NeuD family)
VSILRAAGVTVGGVFDDGQPSPELLARLDITLLGPLDGIRGAVEVHYLAGLGYPGPRRDVVRLADALGGRPTTVVHPSASLGVDVDLSPGVAVWPAVALTTHVRLGRHSHLNVGSSLSHDVEVGEFVTVGPGARVCGSVVLEDDVWIGAGATIIQGVRVGRGSVVGAGAVVLRDVPPGVTVAGVPARVLRDHTG